MRTEELYNFLPAIVRQRDAQVGGLLRKVFEVFSRQVDAIEADVADAYLDIFVETCRPRVLPYIADLVGYRPIAVGDSSPGADEADAQRLSGLRRDIALTIAFRRRKGTIAAIAPLAAAATGWHCAVFENGRNVVATPLIRFEGAPPSAATPDIRCLAGKDFIDRGPNRVPHLATPGRADEAAGRRRWHPDDVIVEAWPRRAYLIDRAPPGGGGGYLTFSPLGIDTQLYAPAGRDEGNAVLYSARAIKLSDARSGQITDIRDGQTTNVYGPASPVCLFKNGAPIPPTDIRFGPVDGGGAPRQWVIDPERGRFQPPALLAASKDSIEVRYFYEFGGDLGGGAYRSRPAPADGEIFTADLGAPLVGQIVAAMALHPRDNLILEIPDNGQYDWASAAPAAPPAVGPPAAAPGAARSVTIRSAPGCRPTIRADAIDFSAFGSVTAISLEGVMLVCGQVVVDAEIDRLRVFDSVIVDRLAVPAELRFERRLAELRPVVALIERCVLGAIVADRTLAAWQPGGLAAVDLTLRDSIIDSPATMPALAGRIDFRARNATVMQGGGKEECPKGAVNVIESANAILPFKRSDAVFVSTRFGEDGYYQIATPDPNGEDPESTTLQIGAFRAAARYLTARMLAVRLREFMPIESRTRLVLRG